jgi:cell division septation protein DedD
MSDEGFHEIQLNGKQLVFLFMAATVVSVVIFLCGVMVGRGVRAERGAVEAASVDPTAMPAAAEHATPPAESPAEAAAAPAQTSAANQPQQLPAEAPPPAEDGADDVYSRMEQGDTRDTLKGRESPKPPQAAKASEPVHEQAAPKKAPSPTAATASTKPVKPEQMPTSSGAFAVQIAALKDRGEADAIARRLAGKGYQAYVLSPSGGRSPVYKVQVGRFKTRQDAERTAARLKKEEQYTPWVTR